MMNSHPLLSFSVPSSSFTAYSRQPTDITIESHVLFNYIQKDCYPLTASEALTTAESKGLNQSIQQLCSSYCCCTPEVEQPLAFCTCQNDSEAKSEDSWFKHKQQKQSCSKSKYEDIESEKSQERIGNREYFAFSQFSQSDNKDKDILNQEEIIQTFSRNQGVPNEEVKENSKRRLYHLRQDVIAKIIFRSFRKYYLREFKAFFDFSKCRRDVNSDTQGELIRQINRFLANKFGRLRYENLPIFLIAVMDIKDKFINISQRLRDLKDGITALLYSYNKIKMINLIKSPEFALLLNHFLSQKQVLQKMVKHRNNQELISAYSELIKFFKSMCSIAMKELISNKNN